MKNASLDGIGMLNGGEYNKIELDGISKLKHPLIAKSVSIDGIFKSKAKIQRLCFDGISRVFRDIKAKKIDINGIVKIRRQPL